MTNLDTNDGEAGPKPRRAEHAYVNAAGGAVDSITQATGNQYTDLPTGLSATWQVPNGKPGKIATMLAAFGARTLQINTASQARQLGEPIIEAIDARFAEMVDGKWSDPRTGGGGPRYNAARLAQAIANVKGESDPAPYAAKIADEGVDKNGDRYGTKAMRNDKVRAEYNRLAGRKGTDEADL